MTLQAWDGAVLFTGDGRGTFELFHLAPNFWQLCSLELNLVVEIGNVLVYIRHNRLGHYRLNSNRMEGINVLDVLSTMPPKMDTALLKLV